uniref:Cas scaffolding protein family member 4 n=1 Tax=Strigops habroptila TaxID=2489341 RepID=A0A672TX75_STRHB
MNISSVHFHSISISSNALEEKGREQIYCYIIIMYFFTNTLAKALYDNKAECSDELAFRKGDILTVLDQNVIGSEGWWRCSLHGRQGLAPANRLQLLTASQAALLPPSTRSGTSESPRGQQNIYQVPFVPKPTVLSSTYEKMEGWVKSPSRTSTLPAQAIYQVPALAAQLLSERTQSSTKSDSEWIYDIPVSPENIGLKQNPSGHSLENQVLYDIPPARYKALTTNTEAKVVNPQLYNIPPTQRKLTFPDIHLYDVPSSRDVLLLPQNGSCDVPPVLLAPKAENQISEENVYDIPKSLPTAVESKKELEKSSDSSGDQAYSAPPQLSRDAKLEQDRLSVSSVDSRTSTVSTSSNSSGESFSISSSEEPAKEIKLDLEVAIETLTRLQHSVSSSVASLMIFVSSKWRLQEHLEKSIEEIHRAVDHVKVSLGEFLAFAQLVKVNASYLTDNKLQTRIKKQLEILTNSFKILTETREALNNCNWSLEALVLRKPQNNPDDLDRFVMVARTIPDDIKRFVSIIIANGKLLFSKNEKEQEMKQSKAIPEYKMAKQITVPRRTEIDSLQTNTPDKSNQSQVSSEKPKENATEDCDYVQLQHFVCYPLLKLCSVTIRRKYHFEVEYVMEREMIVKDSWDGAIWRLLTNKTPSLPEHCRLCFSALHKAIGVFTMSLNNNQPPEVFISHSKLIIMVGQKLVDSLCQETQDRDARNDVLHSSSRFCSLLKNLALATKNAAIQYPNADAMRELQDQTEELSKYTQQFRAMME